MLWSRNARTPAFPVARAVVLHRHRWMALRGLQNLAALRKTLLPRRLIVWLMLHIAHHRERSARRRLISLRATSSGEAEEKILYLIAATVCGQVIKTEEIEQIKASIAPFQRDLASLFSVRSS